MSGGPLVLAIESSCDETAAALLDSPTSLRASVVHSQVALHAQFGGVVPELASRSHIQAIPTVVREATEQAGCRLADVDAIVVTNGPGLVGALLVGVEYAKGLAMALDVPLTGVNHLEGHLLAPFLEVAPGFEAPAYPFVGLVVSGGHTSMVLAKGPGAYERIGRTLDDAAGEAFDKVSKLLGMGYPGGAVIDARALRGDPNKIALPRPMMRKPGFDFSFSGLKTAVAQWVERADAPDEATIDDLCASFQEAACEVLARKLTKAAVAHGVGTVVLSGGVACNSRLRSYTLACAAKHGLKVSVPPAWLCTDNAAMIGAAGYARARARVALGEGFGAHGLDATSSWPLGVPQTGM